MAVTQAQKVDFLLKKIGFTKTKTGLAVDETLSGTKKAGFAEAIPSPLIIANDSLWNESASIPATAPTSDTAQVKVYLASTSGHQMTVDSTVAGNRAFIAFSTYNNTSSARLNNWIDTQFGASYLIKVFRGDPNAGGVQLSAAGSGNNDGWFFDYSAGVLNFNDTNVPSGVTSSNIYIVGYRYIGLTGAPTPTGAGDFTFNNLTVTGDIDVDGHTNLDNVSIAGVTTMSGDLRIESAIPTIFLTDNNTNPDYSISNNNGNVEIRDVSNNSTRFQVLSSGTVRSFGNFIAAKDLDVDGHTNLDNVSIAGVTTVTGMLQIPDGGGSSNRISVGDSEDLKIYHTGNTSTISHNNGSGDLILDALQTGSDIRLRSESEFQVQVGGNTHIQVYKNGGVSFNQAGTGAGKKLETLTTGARVTGTLDVTDGITIAGNIDANGDLDVDGHTNLDNVSVAGVTTFASFVAMGNNSISFDHAGGSQSNQRIFNDGSDFRMRSTSTTGIRIEVNASGGNNSDIKLQTNTIDALVVKGTGEIEIAKDLDVDGHTNLDNVSIAGVTSVASLTSGRVVLAGTGGKLEDSNNLTFDGTTLGLTGNANFTGNLTVGGVLTYEDVKNVDSVGLITARSGIRVTSGVIEAQAGENKIPFLYSNLAALPNAGTYHGMFAHVHSEGRGYFAHAGNWLELVNKDTSGNVGLSGDLDVDGHTNLDNVSIAGITTHSGSTTFDQNITFNGSSNGANWIKSGDKFRLNDNSKVNFGSGDNMQVYHTGSAGYITNNTGAINIGGNVNIEDDLDVDGHTNLDNVSVAGVTTFSGVIEGIAGENKIPFLYSNLAALPNAGTYHGMFAHVHSTQKGYFSHAGGWYELVNKETNGTVGTGTETYNIGSLTATGIDLNGDLDVDGHTNLDNVSISGFTTCGTGLLLNNSIRLRFGNSSNSYIYYDAGSGVTHHQITGGTLAFASNISNTYKYMIRGVANLQTELYYNGSEKIRTAEKGIQVGSGVTVETNGQATFTGIVTASSFRGDGSQLTGISVDATALKDSNGNVKIQANESGAVHVGISTFQDIDVDGHTNLDNVSVAGVSTFVGEIHGNGQRLGSLGSSGRFSGLFLNDGSSYYGSSKIFKSDANGFGLEAYSDNDAYLRTNRGGGTDGNIYLQSGTSAGGYVFVNGDNGVELHHDGTSDKKIETTSTGVSVSGNIDVLSTDTGSSAAPELKLFRNSSSPANADYLGQIKFAGKSNAGIERNYAKITGKILDVTNAGEDGILEFSHIKNGSETITGRWRSDSLQLLNNTNLSVAGNSTFTGDVEFSSTITAGGATGSNGQYLKSTGTGVAWESFPTMRTTTTVTASAGQTTFSFSYNVGFLDVFINGTKLTDSEFTATNGTSVVLAVGCFVGDIVDLISYNTVSGGGGGGGSSITVQDEGSSLSTDATVLNFVGTGVVASGTGATKTITINAGTGDTSNVTTNNLDVVGFSTFASTLLVKNNSRLNFRDANTAIYHDGNFRIESAGSGGDLILKTNAAGGNSNDVVLHGGSVGELLRAHGTGDVDITNTLGIGGSITKASGQLDIRADNLQLKNAASGATYASFTNGGAAELNHNNTKRLETTSNGVNVIGSLFVNGSAIGGGGGGSSLFSQTVAGIHTLSKVGIGTADPEFDLDLGSYISQGVGVAATIRIIGRGFGGNPYATAIRFGAGSNNVDYTLLRVDGRDGTTDGDGNTDLGFALRYMSAGESGTDNRLAFWADNTTKTKYEALSIYNDGRVLVDNGASGGHGFHGHPDDHFTVRGSSGFDNIRVVGVSTFQNVLPQTDSTYDIGTNTVRFRNIYADTLYGDGSNLTGISGGGGTDVGITTNLSGSFSATPGSPATINTLSGYSSDDLVVEYTIYIKNGTNIQTQKLLAMRDGTTIDSTQFAVMFSSSLLAQFDATISSGNILLRATPESGITGNTDYKIKREVM